MLKRPARTNINNINNNNSNHSYNSQESGVIFIEPTTTTSSSISNNKMSSSSPSSSSPSSATPSKQQSNVATAGADPTAAMSSFKLLLLALMVLQNSSTVLVGRYSRSNSSINKEQGEQEDYDLYVVNHLLVVIEMGKLTLSLLLEFYTTQQCSLPRLYHAVYTHCFQNPCDALKIMVPALLYLVQNTLLYIALGNLTAPIFQGKKTKVYLMCVCVCVCLCVCAGHHEQTTSQCCTIISVSLILSLFLFFLLPPFSHSQNLNCTVTYQAKLVTTALVSVVMLQRSYTIQQWICLFGLSMGVATVVLGETASSGEKSNGSGGNLFVGLVAVTISCFSSALAGVYFEMVLKKPNTAGEAISAQPSLWIRNVQLAFFSVLIALSQGWYEEFKAGHLFSSSAATIDSKPYLHGFTFWVWVLVALQAGGGLLVAAVIKYADNVLKGLATGVSVVLSSTLSMMLFATPLGLLFLLGATVILISVWYFSEPCPYSVQQFCKLKCKINLNTPWGYNNNNKSSSSSSSSNGISMNGSNGDDTKSLLPK
jgi:UDP-galactose transporter